MAISDLTGYSWVGNEWLDWGSYEDSTININFSSNSTQFTSMTLNGDGGWGTIYYNNNSSTMAYDEDLSGWTNSAYKTIQITGGTDATNPTLIAWLEANGTLIAPVSGGKTKLGTLNIAKKMFGTLPIVKEVVDGMVVYEKEIGPSGYEVVLYGWDGDYETVYVQINDDPTWYYAQLGVGYGFVVNGSNIPNVYTKDEHYSIAIPNVSKIKIGTAGNPTSTTGPNYYDGSSTGDFANLTFTSTGGSAPAYATVEITMTQDSTIAFRGDD